MDEIDQALKAQAKERYSSKQALQGMQEPSYLDELVLRMRYGMRPSVNYFAQLLASPAMPQYNDPLARRERSPVGFMGDMPTQPTPAAPMALNAFVFNPMRAYPHYFTGKEDDTGVSRFGEGFGYLGAEVPGGYLVNGRYPGFVK